MGFSRHALINARESLVASCHYIVNEIMQAVSKDIKWWQKLLALTRILITSLVRAALHMARRQERFPLGRDALGCTAAVTIAQRRFLWLYFGKGIGADID